MFVPASGLYSDNLIELSSNLSWYSNSTDEGQQEAGNAVTVAIALDHIIS
jgi:translation elongation factor EF-1alpha